jgi:hypothetical protein
MECSLMQAASQALEPPDGPHASATYTVPTGRRGRPRILAAITSNDAYVRFPRVTFVDVGASLLPLAHHRTI